ncbi:MAG: phage major capsid protein [Rhodobacteraceae bacterium]|nr:phage major capsid protein [Paracoccaceae bacterium]
MGLETKSGLETKAGLPSSPAHAMPEEDSGDADTVARSFEEFFRAFEAYRQVNDARLSEIEERGSADVLTLEKLDRLDAALDMTQRRLDDMSLKSRRPQRALTSGPVRSVQTMEHKAAFESYMRTGREQTLRPLERKGLNIAADTEGGYLVPEETEAGIMRRLSEASPIRAIAAVRQVSSSLYKKPFSTQGPNAGWVGESAARPETGAPQLAELNFPTMELYAMPAATASLLDDAVVDIDAWLAEEVETAFAEQEGAAFVNGDGVSKPKGFLKEQRVAESSWEWGKLGTLLTGAASALPSSHPSDILLDLVYSLKSGYRQNARFVMNRKTQAALRKLKDADGNYLWQPPAMAGANASLMNFPVTEIEDMPDMSSNGAAIAFGDFKRGYLVVDRLGVRILRDPYTSKPNVLFYTTKRVGGGVQDYDAIKLLQFATAVTATPG